jgi:glycolate oxidase FAD binding subunit
MSSPAAGALARVEGVVGAGGMVPAQRLADYAVDGVAPSAALQPSSTEEIVEIVKFAAAEGLAIVPCGSRTKLAIGFAPRRYDLALDLSRLNRVVAYDPGDLTLSVEPGVSICGLQASLNEQGQFLPLGAPFAARATVGGTIAAGVDGPLRQFYGTARDFVLGVEFVTGDGVAGKSGGRVVKNVTGYDLHKLMIGSLGTLGILTRINFRTFPAPQSLRGFVAQFSVAEDAARFRDKVAGSALRPLTFEILSPGVAALFESDEAARIEQSPLPEGIFARDAWSVSAGFAGNGDVLDRCEREFRAMAEGAGATGFAMRGTDSAAGELAGAFGRTREFIPIALASAAACTIVKISVLPEHLEHALAAAKHAAEDHSLAWAAMARGVGVIYVALLASKSDEHSAHCVASAAGRLQDDCARIGGHATIPWCPSEWKTTLKIWGAERDDFALMRKVKSVFDPRGILAPGRFAGGM